MMKKPLLNPTKIALSLIGACLISGLMPLRWAGVISSPPRHLVEAVITPLGDPLTRLGNALRRPIDRPILSRQDPQALLAEALVYIRRLESQLRTAGDQITQLTQAREQLNLRGLELVPVAVTAWHPQPPHPTLTINQGRRRGLRPGLVVADGFQLIGRITDVGPVTASVGLITAAQTRLAVRIASPVPDTGPGQVVAQLRRDDQQDDRFWASLDASDPIRVGDLAHLSDDYWPPEAQGLVVGKVIRTDPDPDDPILRQRAFIQPTQSLTHLNRVIVLMPLQGESDEPES